MGEDSSNEPQESDFDYFVRMGCSPEEADLLVRNRVTREAAGPHPSSVTPFVSAAEFHSLWGINERLLEHGSDADSAWQEWADSETQDGAPKE